MKGERPRQRSARKKNCFLTWPISDYREYRALCPVCGKDHLNFSGHLIPRYLLIWRVVGIGISPETELQAQDHHFFFLITFGAIGGKSEGKQTYEARSMRVLVFILLRVAFQREREACFSSLAGVENSPRRKKTRMDGLLFYPAAAYAGPFFFCASLIFVQCAAALESAASSSARMTTCPSASICPRRCGARCATSS